MIQGERVMLHCFRETNEVKSIPISLIDKSAYDSWVGNAPSHVRTWLQSIHFRGEVGQYAMLPSLSHDFSEVIVIVDLSEPLWAIAHLPYQLPEGQYHLSTHHENHYELILGFGLGAYQFDRYKKTKRAPATLYVEPALQNKINYVLTAVYAVRNWINTPADDLGPSEFAAEIQAFAATSGARYKELVGEELLRENYPCIYTVGRASDDPARLIDLRFGNKAHPKVTLVGKGVCFDSGGLDLKPSAYMLLMKKDMGGAAHVLGLASMIMQAKLPINLRVLVPIVENVVSGNSYRPGDVITSRKGLTIEIGNTDAEGRLVLADALTEAASENPDLLIDISTLTGAARVALGTDLPAVFSNNDLVIDDLLAVAKKENDPLWRMPLFAPYREYINSTIADLNNNPSESYGGAITAALFLKEFVPDDIPWLHFDLMAWNLRNRPGRPAGGEAMGLRALFSYLSMKYS